MFEAPRMSPDTIQMLQTNRSTPVQPAQQSTPIQTQQMQAMLAALRGQQQWQQQNQMGQQRPIDPYQEGGGGG